MSLDHHSVTEVLQSSGMSAQASSSQATPAVSLWDDAPRNESQASGFDASQGLVAGAAADECDAMDDGDCIAAEETVLEDSTEPDEELVIPVPRGGWFLCFYYVLVTSAGSTNTATALSAACLLLVLLLLPNCLIAALIHAS